MNSLYIAFKSYSWLWDNKLEVAKISILVLLSILVYQFIANGLLSMPIYFLSIWLASSSMVRLHRFILLDQDKGSVEIFEKPSRTDFIYLLVWFSVFVAERIYEIAIENIGSYFGTFEIVIIILSVLVSIYIFGRIYMVFPAISVGKNLSFAWNLTNRRERVWLTITSTAIFMTPIYIVLIFLIFSLQPSSYLIWASIFISLIFINSHYSQLFKSFTVRKDK